eukprot:1457141-Rhodomonas_salina.1
MCAPAQDGSYLRCRGMDLPKSADDGGRSVCCRWNHHHGRRPQKHAEEAVERRGGLFGTSRTSWKGVVGERTDQEQGHSARGSPVLAVVN